MMKKENVLMFGEVGNRQYIFDVEFKGCSAAEEKYITVYKSDINIMSLDINSIRFDREYDNKRMYYIATI